MNSPAQQKAPESLARLEGEVPASIYAKDTLMVPNITHNLPALPVWADAPYPVEQEAPGIFSRTVWTRDVDFEEGGETIAVAGGLGERTLSDGTLVQCPLVAFGDRCFSTAKAREIAAAILELATIVETSVAHPEAANS